MQSLLSETSIKMGFAVVFVICGFVLATALADEMCTASFSGKQLQNISDQLELLRLSDKNSVLNVELQNSVLQEKLMKGNYDLMNKLSSMQDEAKDRDSNLALTLAMVLNQLEMRPPENEPVNQQPVPANGILSTVLDELQAIKQSITQLDLELNEEGDRNHENSNTIEMQLSQLSDAVANLENENKALVAENNERWKMLNQLLNKILSKTTYCISDPNRDPVPEQTGCWPCLQYGYRSGNNSSVPLNSKYSRNSTNSTNSVAV